MSIEHTTQKPRCIALTASGNRCKRDATNGDLCGLHASYIRNKISEEAIIVAPKEEDILAEDILAEAIPVEAIPVEAIPKNILENRSKGMPLRDIPEVTPARPVPAKVTLKAQTPKTEIQPATSPWDSADNPWSVDKLKLERKHTGFRPKFISPTKMAIRKQEGWVIAQGKDYGEDKTPITRGEMILMEIPEGLAELREDHYRKLTKRRSMSAREILLDEKTKEMTQLTEAA